MLIILSCRNSLAVIKARASEGCRCLETWKTSYLDVRKKIEQSGRDTRWEFDQKKLFERSNYIAQVCSDIYNVAQVHFTLIVCGNMLCNRIPTVLGHEMHPVSDSYIYNVIMPR